MKDLRTYEPICNFETKRGRPRSVEFNSAEKKRLGQLILSANTGEGTVSASMAARVFADEHPPLKAILSRRASKHSLPAAVKEVARRVRPLVSMHRDPRLIRDFAGTHGFLRMNLEENRRYRAGECYSFDDGTGNQGVAVPWPTGGCRASDRFGYKVGRFQLLLAVCHGTNFPGSLQYVIREKQSYRGEDAGSILARTIRDHGTHGKDKTRFVLEGGVWQGGRCRDILEVCGVKLQSAKGRPNCKIVESFFNPLWTRLAIAMPHAQVGRFRGEEKSITDLYLACREGKENPAKHFPVLPEFLNAMQESLAWIVQQPVESRDYGTPKSFHKDLNAGSDRKKSRIFRLATARRRSGGERRDRPQFFF